MLRFKKNDGSEFLKWEQKQLGDIVKENRIPVDNPGTNYTKLAIRSHCKGTFHKEIEDNGLDVDTMFLVKPNNLIVNITFAWEHAIAITKPEDENTYVSHRFPQYEFMDGNLPNFYEFVIKRPRMKYDMGVCSPGGAGRNRVLKLKDFLKIELLHPSIEEQQKIADCLSAVDELIADCEAQVENMQNQKKGVMQKIFSQEVRFKADDGSEFPEWEEKHLKDICKIVGGGTPTTEEPSYWNGDIEWFSPSELGEAKYVENSKRKITELGLKKSSAKLLPKGTILLTTRATLGEMAIALKECCTNQGFQSLVVNEDANRDFVYYMQPQIKAYCKKYASGSTFLEISPKQLGKMPVKIPCVEEQNKIADCLTAFDNAIEDLQKTVDHWKNIKKGLLQQLFDWEGVYDDPRNNC